MSPPAAQMAQQYFGYFQRNRRLQHVVVKTYDSVICRIYVTSAPDKHWFTLEEYDETNKLHVNALILVHTRLTQQTDDDLRAKKWHADIEQAWPGEPRLIPEEISY